MGRTNYTTARWKIKNSVDFQKNGIGSLANIAKQSVPAFTSLFDKIAEELGSQQAAMDYLEITSGTVHRMRNGFLTSTQARKILDGYQALKELEAK